MRLSRQCEIAIDLLVFCAQDPDEIIKTCDAADFAGTTRFHAQKVACVLIHLGLLQGIRGRRGGIRLSPPASHIAVGDVVRLMEPAFAPIDIRLRNEGLKTLVEEATQAAFDTFNAVTIADLAEQCPRARLTRFTAER